VSAAAITGLALRLARACERRGVVVAVAESCTGGGVAEAITRIAGSSAWFDRGFVTYSDAAKRELLGVPGDTLASHGAVSGEAARAMVEGALARSSARVAVAVTGIAGPGGGSGEKPVGLVWFAWAARGEPAQARVLRFAGDREAVRHQSVAVALQGLIDLVG
jgi:nicotinamide-nucleotide amidase